MFFPWSLVLAQDEFLVIYVLYSYSLDDTGYPYIVPAEDQEVWPENTEESYLPKVCDTVK